MNVDIELTVEVGQAGLLVVVQPEQLKAECAVRGWSLTQLARRAGISYPTLRSALRGNPVRPRTAWKLTRALRDDEGKVTFTYSQNAA
jgi:transcriptional regulator with XRE-family HTH domain